MLLIKILYNNNLRGLRFLQQRNLFKKSTVISYNYFGFVKLNSSLKMAQTGALTGAIRFENTLPPSETKSTESTNAVKTKEPLKAQLKRAVAEYGTTVLVFHITISIVSLGISYACVSSGVDVAQLVTKLGFSETSSLSEISTNAGTFAIAYAIHKVFAPVRIMITLSATPFIVRYLRKVGFIKVK